MKPGMWSGQTILKYTLMQLPEFLILVLSLIVVRYWIDLSGYAVGWIIGLWVAKDIIAYPFVWRAYAWKASQSASDAMIGLKGTAKDRLDPTGYVFVRGELWQARATEKGAYVEQGESVIIRKIQGLTLLVEREPEQRVKKA